MRNDVFQDMGPADFRTLPPIDVIRAKCLYCRNTPNRVRLCPCKKCPLYPFRYGKVPKQAGKEGTA